MIILKEQVKKIHSIFWFENIKKYIHDCDNYIFRLLSKNPNITWDIVKLFYTYG